MIRKRLVGLIKFFNIYRQLVLIGFKESCLQKISQLFGIREKKLRPRDIQGLVGHHCNTPGDAGEQRARGGGGRSREATGEIAGGVGISDEGTVHDHGGGIGAIPSDGARLAGILRKLLQCATRLRFHVVVILDVRAAAPEEEECRKYADEDETREPRRDQNLDEREPTRPAGGHGGGFRLRAAARRGCHNNHKGHS
jgi:hypothetical protein